MFAVCSECQRRCVLCLVSGCTLPMTLLAPLWTALREWHMLSEQLSTTIGTFSISGSWMPWVSVCLWVMSVCMCTHTHTHTLSFSLTHTHTHMHLHRDMQVHAYSRMHVHTHTHTHTNTLISEHPGPTPAAAISVTLLLSFIFYQCTDENCIWPKKIFLLDQIEMYM